MTDQIVHVDPNAIELPDSTKTYFSPTTSAFYQGDMYEDYAAGSGWPHDVVVATDQELVTFTQSNPMGKLRGTVDGRPAWVAAPELSKEDKAKVLSDRVDQALNYTAAMWGYMKGIDNATTWSNSTNPQFAAEGHALSVYRDAVWAWVAAQPAGTDSRDGMPVPPTRPQITQGA